MQRRALLSAVNIAVAAGALLVWFRYPRYAYYAIYALFAWFLVSFSLTWAFRGTPGPVVPSASAAGGGGSGTPRGSPSTGSAPAGPSSPTTPLSFCIFCAADLSADATHCPACGHAVVPLN